MLKPKPIKLKKAAEMLGVSVSSIRQGCAGTESLRVFKRPGCRLLFTWDKDVERLLQKRETVREEV